MPSWRARMYRRLYGLAPRPPWRWEGHPTLLERAMGRRTGPYTLAMLRAEQDAMLARDVSRMGVERGPADVEGVSACWFVPPSPDDRVVLYIHGGGFVGMSVRTHAELAASLALATGARVLSVDYRLAPEHPFPAPLDDVCAAYRWLVGSGVPHGHIAVAGDSAGGCLAAALLVALKRQDSALPCAMVLLSPWLDLTLTAGSLHANRHLDPLVSLIDLRYQAAYYLASGGDPRDPLVSPVHADPRGWPSTLIQVGSHEILLDDSARLATAAREAGVPVELDVWEGMFHGWQLTPSLPETRASIRKIAAFLRAAAARAGHGGSPGAAGAGSTAP